MCILSCVCSLRVYRPSVCISFHMVIFPYVYFLCIYIPPCVSITIYILHRMYTLLCIHSVCTLHHVYTPSYICFTLYDFIMNISLPYIYPVVYMSPPYICLYRVHTPPCIGFTMCMSLLCTSLDVRFTVCIYSIPKVYPKITHG